MHEYQQYIKCVAHIDGFEDGFYRFMFWFDRMGLSNASGVERLESESQYKAHALGEGGCKAHSLGGYGSKGAGVRFSAPCQADGRLT